MGLMKILRGEGIECENETARALQLLGHQTEFWDLPKLLSNPDNYLKQLQKNDWVFIPGGFSFADHFGSGRLLAFELNSIQFFERLIEKGASIWGICNGFQVLTSSSIFGDVQLEHNQKDDHPMNFHDRWVKLKAPHFNVSLYYPARHGEGRIQIKELAPQTEAFLFYDDESFENGSEKKIAGLMRKISHSTIVGMMPHPEIYTRPEQNPDYSFSDINKAPQNSLKENSIFNLIFRMESK